MKVFSKLFCSAFCIYNADNNYVTQPQSFTCYQCNLIDRLMQSERTVPASAPQIVLPVGGTVACGVEVEGAMASHHSEEEAAAEDTVVAVVVVVVDSTGRGPDLGGSLNQLPLDHTHLVLCVAVLGGTEMHLFLCHVRTTM